MSRLDAFAAVGLPLLFVALWLIVVAAGGFVVGSGKNFPAMLPYIIGGLVCAAISGPLLVASLRLLVARAR